jgi:hypothetical protein
MSMRYWSVEASRSDERFLLRSVSNGRGWFGVRGVAALMPFGGIPARRAM